MLPQQNRLKHMKDFEILFKEGRFFGGEFVTVKVWQIDETKYPRRKYRKEDLKIGFVVGLKVSKSAVKRNRIKRQIREVVRLMLKEDKIRAGFMVAVMAKPGALEKEYVELKKDISTLFKRARILL